MSYRVHFEDLFEYNTDEKLLLKRKIRILENKYEIGDELVEDDSLTFLSSPEDYFYVVNPLRVGDTLESWIPLD